MSSTLKSNVRVRLLRHDGDPARELAARQPAHVGGVERDAAGDRSQRARDEPEQRRLARSVGPEEADEIARARRRSTPSSTREIAPYANETLSTRSNATPTMPLRPSAGKPSVSSYARSARLRTRRVDVEAAREAHARAGVDDRVAGREEQAAEAAEVRLDVENPRAGRDLAERRQPARRVREVERALMTRPPDQRIADLERRRRERGRPSTEEDLRCRKERIARPQRQPRGSRARRRRARGRARGRSRCCRSDTGSRLERPSDGDDQIVVAVEERRRGEHVGAAGELLLDADVDASAALRLEVRVVGERDLEGVGRPDAGASAGVQPRGRRPPAGVASR